MKRPRFRVLTVTGYTINPPFFGVSGQRHPTVSATVIDGLWNCMEVKTYRAEDQIWLNGGNTTRGNEGAVQAAEDHAAYLNEQWKREQHRDWMRERRARERVNGG